MRQPAVPLALALLALGACQSENPLTPRSPSVAATARRGPKPPATIPDSLVIGLPVEPVIVIDSAVGMQ